MPLRPDLPTALNLSRRPAATPVKLPRMSFPMVGGPADAQDSEGPQPVEMATPEAEPFAGPAQPGPSVPDEYRPADGTAPAAPRPAPAPLTPEEREAVRVIVYGRAGSEACLEAVQDLVDRQVSFNYFDVDRDALARQHLEAICGGEPVVPVVVYIGFRVR